MMAIIQEDENSNTSRRRVNWHTTNFKYYPLLMCSGNFSLFKYRVIDTVLNKAILSTIFVIL
jgi:hypothetical protein